MHRPANEVVHLEPAQGLCQHLFAHVADEVRQLTEAVATLQQRHDDEGPPPGHHIVENDASWAVRGIQVRFRNTRSETCDRSFRQPRREAEVSQQLGLQTGNDLRWVRPLH